MKDKIKADPKVKVLIDKGKKEGFLTQEDILKAFPEAEEKIELLDALYSFLLESNIEVFDTQAEADVEKRKDEIEGIELVATLDRTITNDPVRMYLREIGKVKLLTGEEEIVHSKNVEVGKLAKMRARIEKSGKKVTPKLVAKYMDLKPLDIKLIEKRKKQMEKDKTLYEIERSREELIRRNLRLVVSIAKRYIGRGLPFLDLIQEGNMGLMRAVEKFDWRRGYKFSTYATWWIRQAITRAIADLARTIRIPVHMIETINKYKRVKRALEQKIEREPTVEEVAEEMQIDLIKAKEIEKISLEPTSIETPVGKEEDSRLKEFIPDDSDKSPEEISSYLLLKEHVLEVLQTLSPREQKVLELRFGLLDNRPRTLEEVGKEFGVTRERIRQIEAKALRKLRHPSRSRKLKDYLV